MGRLVTEARNGCRPRAPRRGCLRLAITSQEDHPWNASLRADWQVKSKARSCGLASIEWSPYISAGAQSGSRTLSTVGECLSTRLHGFASTAGRMPFRRRCGGWLLNQRFPFRKNSLNGLRRCIVTPPRRAAKPQHPAPAMPRNPDFCCDP